MTDNTVRLMATGVTVAAGDPGKVEPATITGLAVPWDTVAVDMYGQAVKFLADSLPTDGPAPRLLEVHDTGRLRGIVTGRRSTPAGMTFEAKIARTAAGADAIALLELGAYDAVSVGARPTDWTIDGDGVMVIAAADWTELSLVPTPAFDQARISSVAASHETENPNMETPTPSPAPPAADTADTVGTLEPGPIVQAATVPAQARKPFTWPTPEQWIAAAMEGGSRFAELSAQVAAAAPDVTTTSNDGVLPEPIVGEVYNNRLTRRPVVDAIGVKGMPKGGKVFIRPEVTTHVSQAVQSAENAALTAGEFQISENQVTKAAYGGYVELSEQIIDWSDPSIIGLLLDDMARIYSDTTDNVAADAYLAAQTQTAILTDPTSVSEWVSDLYDAGSTILTNSTGHLPTHLFLAPNMWAALGKLVDSSGRPLFPNVGPLNALGTMGVGQDGGNAFGLTVVVDKNFATDTVIVADPTGFEIFEDRKGAISVDNPSTLSRTVAWRGYFATLAIDPTKSVSLT